MMRCESRVEFQKENIISSHICIWRAGDAVSPPISVLYTSATPLYSLPVLWHIRSVHIQRTEQISIKIPKQTFSLQPAIQLDRIYWIFGSIIPIFYCLCKFLPNIFHKFLVFSFQFFGMINEWMFFVELPYPPKCFDPLSSQPHYFACPLAAVS